MNEDIEEPEETNVIHVDFKTGTVIPIEELSDDEGYDSSSDKDMDGLNKITETLELIHKDKDFTNLIILAGSKGTLATSLFVGSLAGNVKILEEAKLSLLLGREGE